MGSSRKAPTPPPARHLMKEKNSVSITTKCGAVLKPRQWDETTLWHADVSCPDCLKVMNGAS